MPLTHWPTLRELRELFIEIAPSPEEMTSRLLTVERDIILPVKVAAIGILFASLYHTRWFEDMPMPRSVAHEVIERFFLLYLLLNVAVTGLLIFARRLPALALHWVVFSASFVDGLFLTALVFVTGGFDSTVYWLFPGLIVRNALSLPRAMPQLLLNFLLSLCYLGGGLLDLAITDESWDAQGDASLGTWRHPAEPFLLRLIVLWLLTLSFYGMQVLVEKQRQALEEAREFFARQSQLASAGRLAAKIAHQMKNPLSIINNTAYSLQRGLQEAKPVNPKQLEIIREEVERADGIITELMGYAQLAEGKVEKLSLTEAMDQALQEVFPPAAKYQVNITRDYQSNLPMLLMQRAHLREILVNVLLNAREAMETRGRLQVLASSNPDQSVLVTVADTGPGIAPDRVEKIFEPYFSTKAKGTGLGLAIVKNNLELYGGSVRVESELGKGAKFILHFPTRTFMKMQT